MSEHLVPADQSPQGSNQLQVWQDAPISLGVQPLAASPLHRPISALRRYKWLMVAVVAISAVGGYVATTLVKPVYKVNALMMMSAQSPLEKVGGPIRSMQLLTTDDWRQLLTSNKVTDGVVKKLTLFLQTSSEEDRKLFHGFTIDASYLPGEYELVIDRDRKRWKLTVKPEGSQPPDEGTGNDSLGVNFGFKWLLDKTDFAGKGKRSVPFTIVTPREASAELIPRLLIGRRGDFLNVSLTDADPKLAASIVNTWLNDFAIIASQLKQQKLIDFAETLEGQLQMSKDSLDAADIRLSSLRVNTIMLPGENGPVNAGLAETRDPVVRDYINKRIQQSDLQDDIALLKKLIALTASDSIPTEALLQMKTAAVAGPAAQQLKNTIGEYTDSRLAISRISTTLGDSNPQMVVARDQLQKIKTERIPIAANELMTSLRMMAAEDSIRLENAEGNLKKIPVRTIEEERLRRDRDVAQSLYMTLQNRSAEAQLAKAGATPDMTILDSAVAPLQPNKNTSIMLLLMAIGGGIGAAIALAILLDFIDSRLRYPEQVTNELGLQVAGTVPKFPKGGVNQNSPEQMYQLVESFRSLRMSVLQAGNGGPVSIAISSPQPGDGKSLISANLAMSFADAGLRTILVDGDTRRGTLNEVFDAPNAPGLTDYLAGNVSLADVIRPTDDGKLSIIPCGVRRRRSPELLTSPRLPAMVAELRSMYDVVIFDTPPLAAGIDGYSIATATGSLLLVLRVGLTKRRLSSEKLRMFDRLPVNLVGAVLNGIAFEDGNEHYSYVPGYAAADEPPGTALAEVP